MKKDSKNKSEEILEVEAEEINSEPHRRASAIMRDSLLEADKKATKEIVKEVCSVVIRLAIIATAIFLSVHTDNYHWMWLLLLAI